MVYTNFDDAITNNYGIVIERWPLKKFCCPGDLGTKDELSILYNSWNNGTTVFRRMPQDEFKVWKERRFQERLAITNRDAVTTTEMSASGGSISSPTTVPEQSTSNSLPNGAPVMTTSHVSAPVPNHPAPNQDTIVGRPFTNFINTVTTADGSDITIPKKPRKTRSDKGKKKGPRAKATPVNENTAPPNPQSTAPVRSA